MVPLVSPDNLQPYGFEQSTVVLDMLRQDQSVSQSVPESFHSNVRLLRWFLSA